MVSCWPDTHKNIFILPFQLLIESFEIVISIPLGLLNGNFYNTIETPMSYLIINLFYKLPEFILLGYLVFIYLILINKKFFNSKFEFFNTKLILTLFVLIFPNLLLWFSPYKIYDGLRLFLYLIPYTCIIPALAIYYLITNYKNYISKILLTSTFCLFVYYLFIFFSLTPYQYTYLNILNGDFSKLLIFRKYFSKNIYDFFHFRFFSESIFSTKDTYFSVNVLKNNNSLISSF